MSETILRALMQLFALVSDIQSKNEISRKEKSVVRSFLARQLNNELVEKYMKIFDEYLDLYYNNDSKDNFGELDLTSLKDLRIKKICDNINEELRQKQKVYIVIQLIDFISFGEEVTDRELIFLMKVALALNIPESEYQNIKSFIIDCVPDIPDKSKMLVVNGRDKCRYPEAKHICNENLSGELIFLHIPSTKTFIFRYIGKGDLYLNGQHIFTRQTYILDNGSSIKGQGLKTVYYTEVVGYFYESEFDSKIILTAKDLVYKFKDSDNGIQNFNFQEESGQFVGIIGVSGTGKSTLLNLLNGNLTPHSGEININGYNLNDQKDKEKLKGIIGFVPQDDLLIEELTVYQNLYYNARMCLNNFTEEVIRDKVEKILIDFDLYERRDLKVGNPLDKTISGGERKRLNIGLELIREPSVLFVDEPTSGLSSVDSEVVINMLKEQTYKGKLVIINIHQPCSDLYKLFDKIIILDRGGYLIYYGNPNEAIVYFKTRIKHANADEDQCEKCGNINTEQVLQIVEAKIVDERGKLTQLRKVTPLEWSEMFRENIKRQLKPNPVEKEKLPENYYSIPGLAGQMKIFLLRDLLSKLSNRQFLLISLLGAPLLAFILGYFTKYVSGISYVFRDNENLPAYLFMCVITALFLGLIGSAEEIIRDRKILKRESFLNLSWFSYLNSKVTVMFMLSAVQTFSFILVGNFMLGIKGMTPAYWLVLFSTSCFANMLGLNISSAFKSVVTIYILIPFILIPQLLLSGVLVKFDKLHKTKSSTYEFVPFIGDMMTARWAFEALAVKQFKDNKYEKNFFVYEMKASQNEWYVSSLIESLKINLQRCRETGTDNSIKADSYKKLNLYIGQLSSMSGIEIPAGIKTSLADRNISPEIAKETVYYLDSVLCRHFKRERNDWLASKMVVEDSIKNKSGDEGLKVYDSYFNSRLAEMVKNREGIPKGYLDTRDHIVQKVDQIYMEPVSGNGRAQFYNPYKQIGNMKFHTYWYNIWVIWIMSLFLYITLYYNVLRNLVTRVEDLRLKRLMLKLNQINDFLPL
jgi:ABC-type multidrug transport system ATPase subunit